MKTNKDGREMSVMDEEGQIDMTPVHNSHPTLSDSKNSQSEQVVKKEYRIDQDFEEFALKDAPIVTYISGEEPTLNCWSVFILWPTEGKHLSWRGRFSFRVSLFKKVDENNYKKVFSAVSAAFLIFSKPNVYFNRSKNTIPKHSIAPPTPRIDSLNMSKSNPKPGTPYTPFLSPGQFIQPPPGGKSSVHLGYNPFPNNFNQKPVSGKDGLKHTLQTVHTISPNVQKGPGQVFSPKKTPPPSVQYENVETATLKSAKRSREEADGLTTTTTDATKIEPSPESDLFLSFVNQVKKMQKNE